MIIGAGEPALLAKKRGTEPENQLLNTSRARSVAVNGGKKCTPQNKKAFVLIYLMPKSISPISDIRKRNPTDDATKCRSGAYY
jgi:hypothetical protein